MAKRRAKGGPWVTNCQGANRQVAVRAEAERRKEFTHTRALHSRTNYNSQSLADHVPLSCIT